MNIETKLLEDFLSLSQTQSFSRSAQLRYVTQPAFSRRIKQLEQVLDVVLINREVTPIELTCAGKQFIPCARNVLEQLKASVDYIRTVQNQRKQVVNFASTHVLTGSYFPKIVHFLESNMRKFASKLDALDAYDSLELLNNGMCDFLLGFADYKIDHSNFDTLKLGMIELLPVCKPAANGEPLYSLDGQVVDVPLLDYQENIYLGEKVREIRSKMMTTSNKRIRFCSRVESTMADTLKALAMSGLGVAWIPRCNIVSELRESQLVICGGGQWQSFLEIAIFRDNKPKTEYVDQIWQHLLAINLDNSDIFSSVEQRLLVDRSIQYA